MTQNVSLDQPNEQSFYFLICNDFIILTGCIARPLTRDHKPDDPQESQVIHAAGGRIDSYRDS